jgi:predicted RNA-binding protein YlqC (UPF0109 family)
MLRKIIVPFGDTLMIKLKGELEVDTEEQKRLNKDFVPFIEKEIFNYFLDKTESYRTPEFRCVYDLPLRINLIEANIRKQEIKVYLQRPGLFIGRQGKDIDAIRDIIRIKFEMPECEISLVETHGKFDYSNDFDSYYDFPDI